MAENEVAKDVGIGYSSWGTHGDRKEIGIGMFGRGFMGKAHSNAFKKIGYLFESNNVPKLVAISASTKENAESAAARYGYERAYVGYEDLIKDPDVQIFDNVTPDNLHEKPSIAAAQAGKHVICEKPMAIGRESAKNMLNAVTAAGVKHAVCFNYRFIPAVRLAYDLIKKGAIGDTIHFYGRYHQEYGLPLDAPIENVWYQNMSGSAQGLASHMIDQSRFLVGEVGTIMGDIRPYVATRAGKKVVFDDGMRALVEFTNGATGTYESISVAKGRYNQLYWEIYGTKGSLTWDLENPTYLKVHLKETSVPEVIGWNEISVTDPVHPFMNVWWPKGHNTGWEHGHINLIAHFLNAVANNGDVAPYGATFDDGYKVAVILETLGEASLAGKKFSLTY
jgi:predicted dehydrogenase